MTDAILAEIHKAICAILAPHGLLPSKVEIEVQEIPKP